MSPYYELLNLYKKGIIVIIILKKNMNYFIYLFIYFIFLPKDQIGKEKKKFETFFSTGK